LPITLFCIHGNHENRPENILTYQQKQVSEEVKQKILDIIQKNNTFDIVLTHTCPYKYIPREVFFQELINLQLIILQNIS